MTTCRPQTISRRPSATIPRGIDRFADTGIWTRLVTGEPALTANAWLRGKIVNQMDAGDSTVVAVQVLQVNVPDAESRDAEQCHPLVYHNRTWHQLDFGVQLGRNYQDLLATIRRSTVGT